MFTIQRGIDNKYYAVFHSCREADDMEWLFIGKPRACFGQYDNAYRL
jgi:hypothetical protein